MGWKQKQLIKGIAIVIILIVAISIVNLYGINLGLDLEGGSHIVLEAQDTDTRQVDTETMNALYRIIESRIDQLGLAEPRIQRSGDRRLIIELPAVDEPDQAIQVIGRTAQLTFRNIDDEILMTGEHLRDARVSQDPDTRAPIILFELYDEGARQFEGVTRQYLGQQIRIYLDQDLLYQGTVRSVISHRGQISGFETLQEAQDIAVLLREGALPVPLSIAESRTVGPTLGQISIEQSINAGIVGLIFVLIIMIALYGVPGVAACLALVVYGVIFVGLLSGFRAVLTLPGIAGLILSIGMAVDANIIIFERIKEELRYGKTMRAAVDSGFRRALTAIVDANITTIITALVLAYFTLGAVRGFAITLMIGIGASMFTAIFVTRTFVDFFYDVKLLKGIKSFGLARR